MHNILIHGLGQNSSSWNKTISYMIEQDNIIFRCIPEVSFRSMGMGKKDFIELTGSMMDLNFSESLKDILCPVLILCGEKDNPNRKAAKKLAESIVGAKVQFIKNAKHEVNVDAPKELAEILNDFYY